MNGVTIARRALLPKGIDVLPLQSRVDFHRAMVTDLIGDGFTPDEAARLFAAAITREPYAVGLPPSVEITPDMFFRVMALRPTTVTNAQGNKVIDATEIALQGITGKLPKGYLIIRRVISYEVTMKDVVTIASLDFGFRSDRDCDLRVLVLRSAAELYGPSVGCAVQFHLKAVK